MHAARAVKANRERREPKPEARRPSAVSHIGRSSPRSPAVSIDHTKRAHPHADDSNNLNFSYIGFLIAVFGAVPLIVGTFVEVPALWEIGLGVTLVGLFIGVVFWCTELCAEAKKFSQKKNQLSTRGKIEDSNLLQVPDRKFHHENGIESRRGSFQSDSVSLITPMAHGFGSPTHHTVYPSVHQNHNTSGSLGSKQSISQYSTSENSKSNDSSVTLNSVNRANGHLVSQYPHPPPQPKLLLRGMRKDDSRVVSLVQPDPGLEDDSDSDAETVIEAPTGRPQIIQVQTCQEKLQRRRSSPLDKQESSGVVLSVAGHHHPHNPMDPDAFHIENEFVPPLMSLSQQHRTIRMPVMPQEVDKLQRCECGRYLLTERDKLVGIRLSEGGGSSMPATTYNSPSLAGTAQVGAGTAPAIRKVFSSRGSLGLAGSNALESDSNSSSINDISGAAGNVDAPFLQQCTNNRVINVNPSLSESSSSTKAAGRDRDTSSAGSRKHIDVTNKLTSEESIVQVEPTLNSSELLVNGDKTEHHQSKSCHMEDDESNEENVTGSTSAIITRQQQQKDYSSKNMGQDDKDKVLEELLDELTDDGKNTEGILEIHKSSGGDFDEETQPQTLKDDDDDEEFNLSFGEPQQQNITSNKDGREETGSQRSNSASRPTSLALPVIHSDSSASSQSIVAAASDHIITDGGTTLMSSASSASSASTVVFVGDHSRNQQQSDCEKDTKEIKEEKQSTSNETDSSSKVNSLTKNSSLDELLDKIEQKQDGKVLAAVM